MLVPLLAVVVGADVVTTTVPVARPWSIEIDVVQPFVPTVGTVKPKLTRTLAGTPDGLRTDLVVGAYLRPHVEHDVVERIDEYMVVLGARQYLWRGLHVEALLDAGYAWGRNKLDGKDYRTPTLFLEASVGYRFELVEVGGAALFVGPQLGVLGSLGVSDIGPRDGKPDWFLQGNLLVGAAF